MSGLDIRLVFTLPPRENWFQYVRIVIATAINFPCILTLILAELAMNRKIQEISEPKQRIMKIFKIPKFLPLAS